MPLPLLLIGAAVGAVGVGAGIKAWFASGEAKRIADVSAASQREALEQLDRTHETENERLAGLGRSKLAVSAGTLTRIVAIADRVHAAENRMKATEARSISIGPSAIDEMKNASLRAQDILRTGATALTTGALAGFGALGVAGAVGTASTGTAISALSGAAATNATLAWLGGGAISAGGAGMAGGMLALGGIVAGPALAVIGITAAIKAEKSLTEAKEHAAKVDVAIETVRTLIARIQAIGARADQVRLAIDALDGRVLPLLNPMEILLGTKPPGKVPFADLAVHEQAMYKTILMMGSALYQLIEVDLIDELGDLSTASAAVLDDSRRLLTSEFADSAYASGAMA